MTFKKNQRVKGLDETTGIVADPKEFIIGNYSYISIKWLDGPLANVIMPWAVMELEKVNERKKSKTAKTKSTGKKRRATKR
jgi:hypothetical protein